jgi:hypothetical protein
VSIRRPLLGAQDSPAGLVQARDPPRFFLLASVKTWMAKPGHDGEVLQLVTSPHVPRSNDLL